MTVVTRWHLWAAVVVVLVAGCAASPATATVSVGDDVVVTVEVVRDVEAQRAGLAERDDVAGGMLFVFDARQGREVWMSGMMVPLDVAWILNGKVIEIATLQPCNAAIEQQCERWQSPGPVDALLELPAGSLADVPSGAAVSVDYDGSGK